MKKARFYRLLLNLLLLTAARASASDLSLTVDSRDGLLKQLQAKNEELQIQQEFLLKKVVSLKQQIEKNDGSTIKNVTTDNSSKQELIGLKQELEESNAQIEREKERVNKLADFILGLRKDIRVKEEALDKSNLENSALKNTVSNLQASFETCDLQNDEKTKILSEFPQLKKKITELESSVGVKDLDLKRCNEKNSELDMTVSTAIPDLKKELKSTKEELIATKNELMMKEAELEQMGKKPNKENNQQAKIVEHQRDDLFERSGRNAGNTSLGKKDSIVSDVTIVEVLGDKVALRSGPSPEDSEIMSVGKASKLTVEERIGDWFRVIAPNSMRAFIRADMVKVISKSNLDPNVEYLGRAALDSQFERAVPIVRPKKNPLRTINTNNMVPFEAELPKEKVDRAFEQLKSGLKTPDFGK